MLLDQVELGLPHVVSSLRLYKVAMVVAIALARLGASPAPLRTVAATAIGSSPAAPPSVSSSGSAALRAAIGGFDAEWFVRGFLIDAPSGARPCDGYVAEWSRRIVLTRCRGEDSRSSDMHRAARTTVAR